MRTLFNRHLFAFIACIFASVTSAKAAEDDAVIIAGKSRITVITPNLVRIETSENGRFIDEPSLFAIDRAARFHDFKKTGESQIDTGAIRIFTGGTIRAQIKTGDAWVDWTPSSKSERNLGGTLRTLDGVSKPVDLGEGILSRDGWAVIDDSKTPLLTADWVKARPADAGSDIYLFGYGSDYRAALKSLATIAGPVPMPRKYMLGIWYSRYWAYTSDEFKQIVKEYADHDFPLDNIVMDMDWHLTQVPGVKRGFSNQIWTGYTWDEKLIPDPDALLKWFHGQGLHVTLNDHPADGVQPHESMYDDFTRAMGVDPATKATIPFDAGDKKYLDTFWKFTHQNQLDRGVDFWWLDWQQFKDTRSIPGLTNLAWLNWYYYNHTTNDGQLRGASFSRWAGFGDHRHPIHFSGDAATNWATLAFEVPFTATAGNVGCFFWSHDIGGHMGGRNEESYARWCQFGAMTAALRSHSTRDATMDRRPWAYPKWAEDSMRASFHLRSELFPYIYSAVAQSCREMIPLNRPMYHNWPAEEQAYQNPQQFMLGDDVLVAPIASPGSGPGRIASQVVWFPPGSTWFNLLTGEKFTGGGSEQLVAADINEFPIFARAGVPILMQTYTQRMGTEPIKTLIVRVYPGEENQTYKAVLYEDDGVSRDYLHDGCATTVILAKRENDIVTITIGKTAGTYAGQPKTRNIIVELPATDPAQHRPANDDESTRTHREERSAVPIDRDTTIAIPWKVADDRPLRDAARNRRVAGAGGDESALLAVDGIGLVDSYRNPTMKGDPELRFFAPQGAIDRVRVSVVDETGATLSEPRDLKLEHGSAVVPQPGELPLSDKRRALVLSFARNGKQVELRRPLPYDVRVVKLNTNVAKHATVTASSVERNYDAQAVVDGVADGYPSGAQHEWAANGEKVGAWIKLDWNEPQTVDSILLFDRPNSTDQIKAATIEFDDGSKLDVGELPNDGSEPLALHFQPKTIKSLKLTITQVRDGTFNGGLSEIAVFRAAGSNAKEKKQ